MNFLSFALAVICPLALVEQAASASLSTKLDYKIFPVRKNNEAAVVEWGNSAIISALDAAVASFGPQTSHEAFFEVETQPVLATPVNGRGNKSNIPLEKDQFADVVAYPGPLDNQDEIEGNMVVMTNESSNMTPIAMARVAKESGAAALMIVNFDRENPDAIYSLEAESKEEAEFAENHIDIPVIMVSLASGNLITTATVEEDMDEEDIVNNGMPDRIRLYGAGDRPFFEDAISQSPVLYLIHNLLSDEECDALLDMSKGKFKPVDDTLSNLLENTVAEKNRKRTMHNIEKAMLWKGQIKGHAGKQIDERIEQVTGYPQDQFSDWQITKMVKGAKHELHYDHHPITTPVATITVFLNDLDVAGGEIVFPKGGNDKNPIMITPKKAMAVVHHNTDFEGHFDVTSLYGEKPLLGDDVKYVARKFVYSEPLPPSKRIVLPILAAPTGGSLPQWVIVLHDYLLVKFGLEQGSAYFDKICFLGPVLPVLLLIVVGGLITSLFGESNGGKQEKNGKKD